MYKGITLLEILLTLFILSLLLMNVPPLWRSLNEYLVLNREQQRLKIFLQQIQYYTANNNEIWLLLANRQLTQQRWCLTAQPKDQYLCDCLFPQHCPQAVNAYFYYPYFPQQSMLISQQYYPTEITRINGVRHTFSTACFALKVGERQTLFSLFNVGSIRLKANDPLSACATEK
ncbi:type IV pilus minor pilin ComGF family protein [Volucribacter amazonae]|uniref:Prepilin-type N-terminal cleavage/methylation domain-containing protein n=1 Tax=Volucribacter amazonae TaxID=256731 RepID=A0A9X4SL87_9PAST|nr:type IV pilus minor pilin ComGF family protein [Volucribacter amazonae]MDG6895904.1 prepilin-type N-terminal cleavage/methylation domain-containing protein [Volucribacter amazonae]